jgi:hypothetical protein
VTWRSHSDVQLKGLARQGTHQNLKPKPEEVDKIMLLVAAAQLTIRASD